MTFCQRETGSYEAGGVDDLSIRRVFCQKNLSRMKVVGTITGRIMAVGESLGLY